jgi:Bacterial protein of unknown function (DUF839)
MAELRRREFIAGGALAAGALAFSPAFLRQALAAPAGPGDGPYGPLMGPNDNHLMLPAGFSSREIAVGTRPVAGYPWHIYQDGQACYTSVQPGKWYLVSNSESVSASGAGSSAIRFAPDGTIESAYRILAGTNINCAGGPTPWGTWLSCEEHDEGLVWEADPAGVIPAQPRPALGSFSHEAAAVDRETGHVYLTEDKGDGGFYRFTPVRDTDLSAGRLEVAVVGADGHVSWKAVPSPSGGARGPTRGQLPEMTKFEGGEGAWYARGVVYFTTKGDIRVWSYTLSSQKMETLFDRALAADSSLDAVDNVTVGAAGDVLVCEDGGNLEVGLITPEKKVSPFLRFPGAEHAGSELCGVVFSPSGKRMYVTSQRAEITPGAQSGAIYEISGPFRIPDGGVPADLVYGPPIGERDPVPPPSPTPEPTPAPPAAIPDTRKPSIHVAVGRRIRRSTLLKRGIVVRVDVNEPAAVAIVFDSRAIRRSRARRPVNVVLARARRQHPGPEQQLRFRLRLSRRARLQLRGARGPVRARIMISARDAAGNESTVVKAVTIGRAT